MSIGEAELHYPKNSYDKEKVCREVGKLGMKDYWKVEETSKDFVAKFKPPKVKILKEFRKS